MFFVSSTCFCKPWKQSEKCMLTWVGLQILIIVVQFHETNGEWENRAIYIHRQIRDSFILDSVFLTRWTQEIYTHTLSCYVSETKLLTSHDIDLFLHKCKCYWNLRKKYLCFDFTAIYSETIKSYQMFVSSEILSAYTGRWVIIVGLTCFQTTLVLRNKNNKSILQLFQNNP